MIIRKARVKLLYCHKCQLSLSVNIYSKLRSGFVNTTNTYLKVLIRVW